MSAPSEPEKYSIDEMMDRLKGRPAEDPLHEGELVTRDDGSQAIRVRKRKRRSRQPHKEERQNSRRARIVQVSAALILLLLAIFAAGAAIIFANSAPFRKGLIEKITLSTGASVELEQFRVNPTSANAGRIVLTWPEAHLLRDLTLRDVKAEISPSSFLGKSMTGEEAISSEGTLTLRIPDPDKISQNARSTGDALPVRFKRYAIPKLHILLGDPAAPLIRLQSSEGSFHPVKANGRPQLLLSRGDLVINGWPKLRIDRSHIEFRGNEVDVVGMRLAYDTDTRGVFELSGTVAPHTFDRPSTLAVELDSFLVSGIAGPELGRLFSGRIDTISADKSSHLSFTPGPRPNTSLVVTFRNTLTTPFELNGFPFLFGLAKSLNDDWFERPVSESDVTGVLRRGEGAVAISDLSFEHKGRMALRGGVTMAPDRRLSGSLEVGIAEGMIQASVPSTDSRRLDSMFGPSREGFRWITLKIGGTAAAPVDNFKELLESAPKQAKKTEPDSGNPTFEDLTAPK